MRTLADTGACRPDDADDDDDDSLGIELSMRKVKERVIGKGFTRGSVAERFGGIHGTFCE